MFRADAILFCIAGLMVFFGLANYVSVCRYTCFNPLDRNHYDNNSRYRKDAYTLGVSFYSCVFGFLVFECLAVLLMQNSTPSDMAPLSTNVDKRYGHYIFPDESDASTPDIIKPVERRKSFTHIGTYTKLDSKQFF